MSIFKVYEKKIISLVLTVSTFIFSQQTNTVVPALSKTDYLQKSKQQKKAAWILLSGGFVLTTVGLLTKAHEVYDSNSFDRSYSNKETPLTISGTLAMAASIPLFIVAAKNKNKAMSFSFKNEAVPEFDNESIVSLSFPSLTLKLSL